MSHDDPVDFFQISHAMNQPEYDQHLNEAANKHECKKTNQVKDVANK